MHQKTLLRLLSVLAFCLSLSWTAVAQEGAEKPEVDHSYTPLNLKLSEDGKKYVRFLLWHQMWLTTNNLSADEAKLQLTPSIRRSRILAFAQASPRFLILTHFGLNSLTPGNLASLGNDSDAPQFFLHGAWTEFKVSRDESMHIGAGLHYWRGLNRLSSQSTLNFMTLDQSRPFASWHSLGITDQFARHLGVYAKGQLGKFDYRFAVNSPGSTPLGNGRDYGSKSPLLYTGMDSLDADGGPTGNTIIEGYFRYNFWDTESIKLPYNVGSYLGSKKVFAIGAGFFAHPNGMYNVATNEHESVTHFAVDAFLDIPTAGGGCLNAYAAFMNFDYGEDYVSRWAGTGTVLYGQLGYKAGPSRFMPYIAYQSGNYDGFAENIGALDIGVNYFILGHNAKLTLEYHQVTNDIREGAITDFEDNNTLSQLRLQAHIFL